MFPSINLPEIAFVGRSNVGKSSLINTLLNRKGLAKTSSVPGKTRTANFYLINKDFYMVDLPGYGFARVSKKEREGWKEVVESYFLSKRDIRGVCLVVDIRRGIEEEEDMVLEWMSELSIPVSVVLTKSDKLSKDRKLHQLKAAANLLHSGDCIIAFSSNTREGRSELWRVITEFLLFCREKLS